MTVMERVPVTVGELINTRLPEMRNMELSVPLSENESVSLSGSLVTQKKK